MSQMGHITMVSNNVPKRKYHRSTPPNIVPTQNRGIWTLYKSPERGTLWTYQDDPKKGTHTGYHGCHTYHRLKGYTEDGRVPGPWDNGPPGDTTPKWVIFYSRNQNVSRMIWNP